MNQKIQVYIIRTDAVSRHQGALEELIYSDRVLQEIAGGSIRVISLTEHIDLVVNHEYRNEELPLNRVVLDREQKVTDYICGNNVCIRHDQTGQIQSITAEDVEIIEKQLKMLLGISEKEFFYII